MKILFIVPGSGDSFYCGNCFRDSLHAQALRKVGHDVVIMPLYLPLTDNSFKADTPLFFPATTFYVAYEYFGNKKIPRFVEKVLESDTILQMASSYSGTTSAKGMEGITLSMIQGNDRVFNNQVNKLIDWIEVHAQPDVIHLSTSLLIGIAKSLKAKLNIPVVCSLQDEEVWLDSLDLEHTTLAWNSIAENVCFIDRFVTTSKYYREIALSRVSQIKAIDVIYPGINISKYATDEYPENPVIGFFYRMNYENGLDILAEAFVILKEKHTIKNLKLKIGGGHTRENKKFIKKIEKILSPYINDVSWTDDYRMEDHASFYKDISLISVPIRFNESVGLYLCEAFAAGRPAVEPDTGSFREIIRNAGILYSPNNSDKLAETIEKILVNDTIYNQYCANALSLSKQLYNDDVMAEKQIDMYKTLVDNQ